MTCYVATYAIDDIKGWLTPKAVCVHFVGVTPDQRYNAVKVWGAPDYEHPRATWSIMGEIAETDVVVLGRAAFPGIRKGR